jgi:hypothetical protein
MPIIRVLGWVLNDRSIGDWGESPQDLATRSYGQVWHAGLIAELDIARMAAISCFCMSRCVGRHRIDGAFGCLGCRTQGQVLGGGVVLG